MISLSGIVGSRYWYEKSYESFLFEDNQESVGYISESENLIEKRPKKRLLWFPLAEGENLYKGDTVRSGVDAKGVIFVTEANLKIELEPASLIQLNFEKKELNLNLLNGSLRFLTPYDNGATHKPLANIKIGDKILKVEGGDNDGFIAKSKDGAYVSMASGVVNLGNGVKVSKGNGVLIGDGGKALRPGFKILSPVLNKVYLTPTGRKKKIPIKLSDNKGVSILLGTRIDDLKQISLFNKKSPEITASAGTYYFKVIDEKTKKDVSPLIRFSVSEVTKPLALLPTQGEEYFISDSDGTATVRFEWLAKDFEKIEIEYSDSIEFKGKVNRVNASNKRIQRISFGSPGVYYWRLKGTIDNIPIYSSSAKFTIKNLPKPKKPVITSSIPKEIQLWQLVRFGSALSFVEFGKSDVLVIESIKGPTDRKEFRFKSRNIVNINEIANKAGNYSFRAKVIRGSTETDWSEVFGFNVKENSPLKIRPLSRKINLLVGDKVEFAVQRNHPSSKIFEFEFKNLNGKKSLKVKSANDYASFDVTDSGNYELIVTEYLAESIPISKTTKRQFEITVKDTFPPPTYIGKSRYITASKKGDFTARFSKPTHGDSYQYLLIKNGRVVKKLDTKELMFKGDSMLPGKYELQVRTYNKKNKLGDVNTIYIKVPNVNNLKKPKLKGIRIK